MEHTQRNSTTTLSCRDGRAGCLNSSFQCYAFLYFASPDGWRRPVRRRSSTHNRFAALLEDPHDQIGCYETRVTCTVSFGFELARKLRLPPSDRTEPQWSEFNSENPLNRQIAATAPINDLTVVM